LAVCPFDIPNAKEECHVGFKARDAGQEKFNSRLVAPICFWRLSRQEYSRRGGLCATRRQPVRERFLRDPVVYSLLSGHATESAFTEHATPVQIQSRGSSKNMSRSANKSNVSRSTAAAIGPRKWAAFGVTRTPLAAGGKPTRNRVAPIRQRNPYSHPSPRRFTHLPQQRHLPECWRMPFLLLFLAFRTLSAARDLAFQRVFQCFDRISTLRLILAEITLTA